MVGLHHADIDLTTNRFWVDFTNLQLPSKRRPIEIALTNRHIFTVENLASHSDAE